MATVLNLRHWLHWHWLMLTCGVFALVPLAVAFAFTDAYSMSVPYGDQWRLNAPVAIAAADGNLTLSKLVTMDDGHRTFFTNALTAITTLTTGWDIRIEAYLSFAVCVIYALTLVAITRRWQPQVLFAVLIPVSGLIFSLTRETSWWSSRHSQWSFSILFFVAVQWLIARRHLSWRLFVTSLVFGICATFSMGNGMLVWPCGLLVLWSFDHRDRLYLLTWVLVGAASVGLYFSGSGIGIGSEAAAQDSMNSILVSDPGPTLQFIAIYLARSFTGPTVDLPTATFVTLTGAALFVVNGLVLVRNREQRQATFVWIIIALFSLGSGLIISLGRVASGMPAALQVQYISVSALFWIALTILIAMVVLQTARSPRPSAFSQLINTLNILLAGVFIVLFFRANILTVQKVATFWEHDVTLGSGELRSDEACVLEYPLHRNDACLWRIRAIPEFIDQLAVRRLGIFTDIKTQSLLPSVFAPNDVVVIASDNLWQGIHLRDWVLAGVATTTVVHLVKEVSPQALNDGRTLSSPPLTIITHDQLSTSIEDMLNEKQVWVLETDNADTDSLRQALYRAGYTSIYANAFDQPLPLQLTGYRRLEDSPQPYMRFGTDMLLVGWSIDWYELEACQLLSVETLWMATEVVSRHYSMTAVIADSDGIGISRNDGPPAALETTTWLPGQIYADRRQITVPCDVQGGAFPVLLGLYDAQNMQSMAITGADGNAVGNLLYLTTLTVHKAP